MTLPGALLKRGIVFPSGKTIRTIGEPETHLWFVLAGELKESYYQLIGHKPRFNKQRLQQGANRLLGQNHVFGDVFPFTEVSLSQSVIETTVCTEVIAIPRRRLIQVCQKFPKVELGVLKLLQIRSETGADSPSGKIRRGERYAISIRPAAKPDRIRFYALEGMISNFLKMFER